MIGVNEPAPNFQTTKRTDFIFEGFPWLVIGNHSTFRQYSLVLKFRMFKFLLFAAFVCKSYYFVQYCPRSFGDPL